MKKCLLMILTTIILGNSCATLFRKPYYRNVTKENRVENYYKLLTEIKGNKVVFTIEGYQHFMEVVTATWPSGETRELKRVLKSKVLDLNGGYFAFKNKKYFLDEKNRVFINLSKIENGDKIVFHREKEKNVNFNLKLKYEEKKNTLVGENKKVKLTLFPIKYRTNVYGKLENKTKEDINLNGLADRLYFVSGGKTIVGKLMFYGDDANYPNVIASESFIYFNIKVDDEVDFSLSSTRATYIISDGDIKLKLRKEEHKPEVIEVIAK